MKTVLKKAITWSLCAVMAITVFSLAGASKVHAGSSMTVTTGEELRSCLESDTNYSIILGSDITVTGDDIDIQGFNDMDLRDYEIVLGDGVSFYFGDSSSCNESSLSICSNTGRGSIIGGKNASVFFLSDYTQHPSAKRTLEISSGHFYTPYDYSIINAHPSEKVSNVINISGGTFVCDCTQGYYTDVLEVYYDDEAYYEYEDEEMSGSGSIPHSNMQINIRNATMYTGRGSCISASKGIINIDSGSFITKDGLYALDFDDFDGVTATLGASVTEAYRDGEAYTESSVVYDSLGPCSVFQCGNSNQFTDISVTDDASGYGTCYSLNGSRAFIGQSSLLLIAEPEKNCAFDYWSTATGNGYEKVFLADVPDSPSANYTAHFVAMKKLPSIMNLSYTKAVYSGTAKKPVASIKGLVRGTDFSVTYSKNIAVGKATVTAKGLYPNYYGTVTKKFTIVPKKAVISKTTPGRNKLTVKMKTKVSATGGGTYQIAYKQKGTSKWKYTTTTYQSKAVKNLKKGKRYYVKVRALKTVNKVKYYGAWSKTKLSYKIK